MTCIKDQGVLSCNRIWPGLREFGWKEEWCTFRLYGLSSWHLLHRNSSSCNLHLSGAFAHCYTEILDCKAKLEWNIWEKRIIGWSIYHTHGEGIIKGNKHTHLCKGGTNSLKKITALWMYTIANSDYLLHCGTLMMYLCTTFTASVCSLFITSHFTSNCLQVSCAKSLGCSRDDRLGRVHCFDWHASVKNWGKLLKAE